MSTNQVSITTALAEAWERMKVILFRPFDLKKWFVLGFTAWLAGLASGGGSTGSSSWEAPDLGNSEELKWGSEGVPTWIDWPRWSEWLLEHPIWLAAGVLGCVFLIAVALAVLWVSSRGKFMFLDNVVHNRAEVVRPWKRYRRVANSHFGFQLAFLAALLAFAIGLGLTVFATVRGGVDLDFDTPAPFIALAIAVPALVLIVLIIAYLQYFLDGFVVPLMYRYDLKVMAAWSRFGGLFRRHPFALLLSGPFLLLLGLAVVVTVLVAGLLTCCIGFLLVIIPYIGTVVLLPVPVTYRGFTVALLDQMDPGFFPSEPAEADRGPL